jgi:hypothetical protein
VTRLSIIIVNYNTCALLQECLRSIRTFQPRFPWEVIVVDNGSSDGSVQVVRAEFPGTVIIANPTNRGFSVANNQGLRQATGDYLLLLNSDTRITAGALDGLVEFMEQNADSAAAAPMLLNSDGTMQRSCFHFPSPTKQLLHILGVSKFLLQILRFRSVQRILSGRRGLGIYTENFDGESARKVSYALFACFLVRRSVLEKVGLLDERLFYYHEECEFGYRLARAGLGIWWVPKDKVVHLGGGASGSVVRESFRHYYVSLLRVFRKHESSIPNFALRISVSFGFLTRALLTLFGFYRYLEIPSTYGRTSRDQRKAFGSPLDRVSFYGSIATLPWKC